MCIRDRINAWLADNGKLLGHSQIEPAGEKSMVMLYLEGKKLSTQKAVSYTHLRAHETVLDLVCRLLLEKKTKHNLQVATTPIHTNTTN